MVNILIKNIHAFLFLLILATAIARNAFELLVNSSFIVLIVNEVFLLEISRKFVSQSNMNLP